MLHALIPVWHSWTPILTIKFFLLWLIIIWFFLKIEVPWLFTSIFLNVPYNQIQNEYLEFLNVYLFTFICLKDERDRESLSCWFIAQMPTYPGLSQGEARSIQSIWVCPVDNMGPSDWVSTCFLSECVGRKLDRKRSSRDANQTLQYENKGIPRGGLTHWGTISVPENLLNLLNN